MRCAQRPRRAPRKTETSDRGDETTRNGWISVVPWVASQRNHRNRLADHIPWASVVPCLCKRQQRVGYRDQKEADFLGYSKASPYAGKPKEAVCRKCFDLKKSQVDELRFFSGLRSAKAPVNGPTAYVLTRRPLHRSFFHGKYSLILHLWVLCLVGP